MCLIDMFFYRPVSFMGLYAFYDVLRLYCEFSWRVDSGMDFVAAPWHKLD